MIPSWSSRAIGEVCELVNGRAFKPEEWSKAGLPIIRIQNLNDPGKPFNYFEGAYAEKHLVDSSDVLLSWSGTPGTSFGCFVWRRGKALLNQHIFKVRVHADIIIPEFFVHSVNNRLRTMIDLAHGAAGLRHITKTKLESIRITVPSLDVQRRMVGRIDECIQRLNEIKKLRSEQAKLKGHLLRAARTELLGGRDGIPAGWSVRRLQELSDVIYGISEAISANRDPSIGPPIIRMANISKDGFLDLADLRYCTIPAGKEQHFVLRRGDLLLNWRSGSPDHVGKTALFDSDGVFTCASFILRIRTNGGVCNNRYLRHVLNHMRAEGIFVCTARMQINHKLNAKEFSALSIRVPASTVQQERIAEQLDAIESVVRRLNGAAEPHSVELAQLREAILSQAFSGEL